MQQCRELCTDLPGLPGYRAEGAIGADSTWRVDPRMAHHEPLGKGRAPGSRPSMLVGSSSLAGLPRTSAARGPHNSPPGLMSLESWDPLASASAGGDL